MKKYNILFILVFVLIAFVANAQRDYHFSQFFASPITYNPANAGAFEADFRAMANYRNQYSSISEPYRTFGFSADAPIKLSNDNYDQNFLGVGLSVVNDNAGVIDFNTLNIAGNVAYAIDLGGTDLNPHFISLGLQIGYIQRSQNFDNASWQNQWTGTSFNQGLPSGEGQSGVMKESNIDLGAGVSWYNSIDDYTKILLGGSVLHANAPKVDLLGDEDNLLRKYTGHVSLAISDPNAQVTYLPNLFVMFQGPNRIIDFGSEVEFSLWDRTEYTDFRNNMSINLGAYYRYKDAIYFIGRLNYYDFSLGISYDFTASSLAENNNGQGGVELVLSYRTRFTGPGTNRQRLIRSKGL
jgi:type IX secretion system PorP/SprF family membrane protein